MSLSAAVLPQVLQLTSSVVSMGQDQLSERSMASVMSVVNIVCESGERIASGGVSSSVLRIASRLNAASASRGVTVSGGGSSGRRLDAATSMADSVWVHGVVDRVGRAVAASVGVGHPAVRIRSDSESTSSSATSGSASADASGGDSGVSTITVRDTRHWVHAVSECGMSQ